MLGFETIGNATIIAYDGSPILATILGSMEMLISEVGVWVTRFLPTNWPRSEPASITGYPTAIRII